MNNPLYDDDRISAYLDGELSADEQGRFEERLAESAELRQLVDELRALRGSLELLPRHKLEADFADRVLRRAEREMLASEDAGLSGSNGGAPSGAQSVPATRPAELARSPRDWKRRALRPLIYAAVAIAAAILIVIAGPDRSKERKLAEVTNPSSHIALPEGEVSAQNSTESLKKSPLAVKDQVEAEKEHESVLDRESLARDGAGAPVAPSGKSRSDSLEFRGRIGPESATSKPEPGISSTAAGGRASRRGLAGGVSNAGAKREGEQAEIDNLKVQVVPETSPKTPALQHASERPPVGPYLPRQEAAGKDDTNSMYALPPTRSIAAKESLRRNVPIVGGVVVAQCVSAREVAERTFERLLIKSDIEWRDAADVSDLSAAESYAATERPREQLNESNKKLTRSVEQPPVELGVELSAGRKLAKADEKRVDVILVEGTTDQIKELVYGLEAEPKVFGSVTIVPAPISSTYAVSTFGFGENSPRSGGEAVRPQLGNGVDFEVHGAGADKAELRELGRNDSAGQADSAPTPHAPAEKPLSDSKLSDENSDALSTNGPVRGSFRDFKRVPPETSKSAAAAPSAAATPPAPASSPAAAAGALNSPKDARGLPHVLGETSAGRAAAADSGFAENRAGKPAEPALPAVRTDETKEKPQTRGFALRLQSLPTDAEAAIVQVPVEEKQKAIDAPLATDASPKAGAGVGGGLNAPPQNATGARGGSENATLAKPAVAAPVEADHTFYFSATDPVRFGADRGGLPEIRMQAYFVFRRAPVPSAPAAAAPASQPAATKQQK